MLFASWNRNKKQAVKEVGVCDHLEMIDAANQSSLVGLFLSNIHFVCLLFILVLVNFPPFYF